VGSFNDEFIAYLLMSLLVKKLNISQHLAKLQAKVQWHVFFIHNGQGRDG